MKTTLEKSSEVSISAGDVDLQGNLEVPENASGVVLFAHGSGSSRHSPRNRFVAGVLREGGLATLLLDLLSAEEEQVDLRTVELRFDIELLGERFLHVIDWLCENPETSKMKIGLFGSSTGAGAALVAAAHRPESVAAVVLRGGRPDLAGDVLGKVQAPTLLIVGAQDVQVIELNRDAMKQMSVKTKMEIIPHATHLFEEPGALEEVSRLATHWFQSYLCSSSK